ncbi:hypothetical protein [Streptomyces fuscichromogenes]|uniref:Secreted protein n=1 Tax=Streptomyces fuscichromogenes TaxID=1324013 RepID=A0A917XJS3_9ACTN|nr:hypothetical protein [Streptomyces fuscichromogenes]GGN32660.1 hypothetical protein GCM10011578_071620 [Streptomyces fuscichromogenes]
MKPTLRTVAACALAVAAVATALGTAQAGPLTLAPARRHATAAVPAADEHDPKEDVELDENGRPDLNED